MKFQNITNIPIDDIGYKSIDLDTNLIDNLKSYRSRKVKN